MLLIAIAFFTVFSALCGAATEILELYVNCYRRTHTDAIRIAFRQLICDYF